MKRLELFQNKLYQRAKEDRNRCFHSLHDKLCRLDILEEAWKIVSANHGAAGIDEQTVEDIRTYGKDRFLGELKQELISETYEVSDVRRLFIPKPDGRERPLGIPTVKDRVVQQAVKLIIEPIFEADFKEFSYGYRPGRSARQASGEIMKYLNYGLTNIIDIDIRGFFDHINHEKLMFSVSRRIADPYILKLIREWLRADVVFNGEKTYPQEGTPQGGVISPLLANIYLNELDTLWVKKGMDQREGHNAHLVRYADDMIILTDREPESAMDVLKSIIYILDLELNAEKSRITTAQEGFDFLGFHFVRKWSSFRKKEVTYIYPSRRSTDRFREKVAAIIPKRLAHIKPMDVVVRQLNSLIVGWYNYYSHTNASGIFKRLQKFINWKVTKYYCYIHKIRGSSSGKDRYLRTGKLGIASLERKIHYVRNSVLPEVKYTG
jgi:RNA-directed DNA polymerase